jgi:hypothetical protein
MNIYIWAGFIIAAILYVPLCMKVWRGQVKQSLATWGLWTALDAIAATSVFISGGAWAGIAFYVLGGCSCLLLHCEIQDVHMEQVGFVRDVSCGRLHGGVVCIGIVSRHYCKHLGSVHRRHAANPRLVEQSMARLGTHMVRVHCGERPVVDWWQGVECAREVLPAGLHHTDSQHFFWELCRNTCARNRLSS